jgi:serine-type D-Ala-D-Ala carboxypeptidase (penicillin-binding protein 5/6)
MKNLQYFLVLFMYNAHIEYNYFLEQEALLIKIIFIYLMFTFSLLSAVQPVYSFSHKSIAAKAWIVIDENDSVLSSKYPSVKLPPASTVKLVTAMVALDNLDPAAKVIVSSRARAARSGKPRLMTNDELTVSDLLHLALMRSNNSAAVALAEAAGGSEDAFVALMNLKVKEIGANDTHFVTASGLPKGRQYTTALDLTIILKKALTYPIIREILGKKEWIVKTAAGRDLYLSSTDNLLWSRSNMVGGKTGFTCNARHCFVGAMDTEKGLIYTAVLGAPSRSRLWKNTLMLADIGMNRQLDHLLPASHEPLARFTRRDPLVGKGDRAMYQNLPVSEAGIHDQRTHPDLPF